MNRSIALLAAALLGAGPALARESLPRDMLGLWADSLASCQQETSDGRMTIEPRWIEFAASGIMVRRWERRGPGWRGVGRWGEEGEGTSRPGAITLRLLADGRMQVDEGADKRFYVRCPVAGRRAS
jgi:hypothetical protein